MLGTICRNGVMSNIYYSDVQFNFAYKFCFYTINTENQSADIKLSLPANKKITIYWGDGTSTVVTGEVALTTYSHTYANIKTYNLTVSGDYNDITYLMFDGDGSYGGDIKYLPDNLTMYYCDNNNTITGDIKNLPRFLVSFRIKGQNTIFGYIADSPPNIIFYIIKGNNTITGDISLLPDSINYFSFEGNNTINKYSGKTWNHFFSWFGLIPVSPGGLSSAKIDQLLIDLDEDLNWSGGGTIILTGTNAPRTSASDDAVNNMIAEGATITTN